MNVYAVTNAALDVKGLNARFRSTGSYRCTWPYHKFFHGDTGSRPVVNRYGERPYRRLPIRRNLRLTPPVVFPGIRMVVNEDVAGRLSAFDGVHLNPCEWEAVYDHPVDESAVLALAHGFPDMWGDDREEWLGRVSRSPSPRTHLPPYFELLAPRHEVLRTRFGCDTALTLPDLVIEEFAPVPTCAGLHDLYPVVTVAPYYLLSERAWPALEPHVSDGDLFLTRRFDLTP